jgi:hypothetical protein
MPTCSQLMPWWQRHCLDVYAAAGLGLAAILGVMVVLLRAGWRSAARRLAAALGAMPPSKKSD